MDYTTARLKTHTAVLIPCLNEEKTIAETCRQFKHMLPHALICVGDNNSSDNTKQAALSEPACDAVIKCPKQGKGAATKTLVDMIDAEWYLTVDGDMTYDPDAARILLNNAAWTDGIVTGVRRLSHDNQAPFHQFGNKLVDMIVSLKYKTKVHDVMSGYRAIPGHVLKDFVKISPYAGFEIETALIIYALSRNIPISYIACNYFDRPEGSKSKIHTFKDGLKILKTAVSIRF